MRAGVVDKVEGRKAHLAAVVAQHLRGIGQLGDGQGLGLPIVRRNTWWVGVWGAWG